MLRNLVFGQYVHKDSLVHKIDPRIKILAVIFLSIVVFLIDGYSKLSLMTVFIILIATFSKISIRTILKNLRPFLIIFAFIFLMYFFFSREQLGIGILTVWRFVLLVVIASILTYSTTISSLVLGLERILSPLRAVGVNTRTFALLISITIRFIPVFFMRAMRLMDSVLSRLGSLRKIKHIKIFIMSLLERILKSASNLGDAVEARGYNRKSATHFKELNIKPRDFFASAVVVLISILITY
ncbi:energy-coupling factor transporter transmembrane protein EcfT [Candidatus Woesearchaeota archaeon]|nr:energy-coupling factor transporter transmembrane protein EcfT [Candidatus Woesearchaeota archaeon]